MTQHSYFATPLGVPTALPDGLDGPYHEGLREHRLVLPRCSGCGTWQWPPDVLCWNCHRFGLDWIETQPRGEIYSWTRTWHPARPSLADAVPYLIVLVALPAAGDVRLLGNLLGPGDQQVRCGDEVIGSFEDAPDGGGYTLLQWTTAETRTQ